MLRVEYKDADGKWHTYYVKGTAVHRTLLRERRKLAKHGVYPREIAVERM